MRAPSGPRPWRPPARRQPRPGGRAGAGRAAPSIAIIRRSGAPVLLRRLHLVEALRQRVPRQRGALDPHRELDDALERLEVAELDLGIGGRRVGAAAVATVEPR